MAENDPATRSGRNNATRLAALGLAILALAGYWLYAGSQLVFKGLRTSGVVTGLTAVMDAQGRALGFAPVVKYSDERGTVFVHRSAVPDNPAAYAPGDFVPVYYDQANPARALIRGFRETFAVPLLIAIVGSFFLLLAAITTGSTRSRARPNERLTTQRLNPQPEQAARLQFHPFNGVAYKHYLGELKGTGTRKVKITDAAVALPEERNPVALCEFLATMAAICCAKDAESFVAKQWPHLVRPRFFKARNTRAFAFLFEYAAYIVLSAVDLDSLWLRLGNATALRTGPHDWVPSDVIWEAAPRHAAFAKEWDALRVEIEQWVKDVALKSDPARPFIFSGHAIGGALACLGAYEFAKRGRVVSGVITFGAPPPGGQAFADEYNQLGLEERTLRLEFDADAKPIATMPLLYVHVGREWRLDRPALLQREPTEGGDVAATPQPAPPKSRSAYAAYSLQRRYGLVLSALIYQRLRELIASSGTAADCDAAYKALTDHLNYIRGGNLDQNNSVFANLMNLPVKIKDAADLEALKTAFPQHVI